MLTDTQARIEDSAAGALPSHPTAPQLEQPLTFEVAGDTLVGLLHRPPSDGAQGHTGVVIVVGGPQVRAGSHRQFVHLARHLAAAGHPVLRFDARGMGDSTGAQRSFEQITPDIGGAIDALLHHQPQVQRVVLWGLCDGASAALLYLDETADPRVAGLALANPWVRSDATLARTQVKHYYRQRLMQREFWLKLLRGQVAGAALRGLWSTLRLAARSTRAASKPAGLSLKRPGQPQALCPFPERMARGWRCNDLPTLLLLSGRDYTAREFEEVVHTQEAWRGMFASKRVHCARLNDADHTFSGDMSRNAVAREVAAWLSQCGRKTAHDVKPA